MLRTVPLLVLVLFAILCAAQTADDFPARYGHPDVEKFHARPEITMTVGYSEDDVACEVFIEPSNSNQSHSSKEPSMETKVVAEIIDELIPPSQRGVLLNHSFESMGAAQTLVAEYQNVTISQFFVGYLPPGHDQKSATIVRKDKLCKPGANENLVPVIRLSAADLHNRYGDPDVQRFPVRSGVTLSVTYGQNRAVCELVVEPTPSKIPREEPVKYMRPELMTEIIDENVPEANRGRLLLNLVSKDGCNEDETADYENVKIERFRQRCGLPNPEIESPTTITLKTQSCAINSRLSSNHCR